MQFIERSNESSLIGMWESLKKSVWFRCIIHWCWSFCCLYRNKVQLVPFFFFFCGALVHSSMTVSWLYSSYQFQNSPFFFICDPSLPSVRHKSPKPKIRLNMKKSQSIKCRFIDDDRNKQNEKQFNRHKSRCVHNEFTFEVWTTEQVQSAHTHTSHTPFQNIQCTCIFTFACTQKKKNCSRTDQYISGEIQTTHISWL